MDTSGYVEPMSTYDNGRQTGQTLIPTKVDPYDLQYEDYVLKRKMTNQPELPTYPNPDPDIPQTDKYVQAQNVLVPSLQAYATVSNGTNFLLSALMFTGVAVIGFIVVKKILDKVSVYSAYDYDRQAVLREIVTAYTARERGEPSKSLSQIADQFGLKKSTVAGVAKGWQKGKYTLGEPVDIVVEDVVVDDDDFEEIPPPPPEDEIDTALTEKCPICDTELVDITDICPGCSATPNERVIAKEAIATIKDDEPQCLGECGPVCVTEFDDYEELPPPPTD